MLRRLSFLASTRAFLRDERGGIAIIAAAFAICGVGALAIGVDVASVFVERRRAQSAVDLAAIAAASDPDKALLAATATVNDNGVPGVRDIRIIKGSYIANPAIPANLRFVPNGMPINAVMVELESRAQAFFGKSFLPDGTMDIATRATAVATAQAAFTVGSRLASLDGGILNALLNGLLGNLALNVNAGGLLTLTPNAVLIALIRSILNSAAPAIDGALNNVLKTLGIGLGEADVWVNGVRCDGAALVR